MSEVISCCGVVCSDCPSFPEDCKGCPEIKGQVYWLQYTGEPVCVIYNCCVNQKKLPHCGECAQLPCTHYDRCDPTKSPEENAEDHQKQLAQLKLLRGEISQ